MKMLKKLALVSAISMISAGTFAMEAMDDESMAAATGQDGITINIVPAPIVKGAVGVDNTLKGMGVTDASMTQINPTGYGFKGLSIGEIRVHDDDGLGALGTDVTANSGALVIGGGRDAIDLNGDADTLDAGEAAITAESDRTVIFAKGDKPIQLNIDMVGDYDGAGANTGAMLNVQVKLPTTAIKLGNIYVADSNAAEAGWNADGTINTGGVEVDGATVSGKVKILDGLEVVIGEGQMNIQLGNEAQGHMIVANSTLTGGLTINNFALYDQANAATATLDSSMLGGGVTSGGAIRAKSISILNNTITGANGADLTVNSTIDVGSRVTGTLTVSAGAQDTLTSNVAVATAAASTDVTNAYGSVNAITTAGGGPVSANITSASLYADVVAAKTNLTTALINGRDAAANAASSGTFATYADAVTAANGGNAGAAAIVNAIDTDPNVIGVQKVIGAVDNLRGLVDTRVGIANDISTRVGNWGGVDTYNGLVITTKQLGDAVYGANLTINNLALGDTNASVMGDIQIVGLRMGTDSKIVIMGH